MFTADAVATTGCNVESERQLRLLRDVLGSSVPLQCVPWVYRAALQAELEATAKQAREQFAAAEKRMADTEQLLAAVRGQLDGANQELDNKVRRVNRHETLCFGTSTVLVYESCFRVCGALRQVRFA